MERRSVLSLVGVVAWGAVLALWLSRGFFLYPVDAIHENHEADTYVGRLIEFRDLLAAGYWSPQWCTDFRGGLGSPYFGYYQPGLFYLASAVPWCVPAVRALGIAVALLGLAGYLGTFALVARRFATVSGWLAASGLLLSSYAGTEIYVRGDLSEFAAMMIVPVALWALWGWLDQAGWPRAACLACAGAALIVSHPAVALIGYAILGVALLVFSWRTPHVRRVFVAAGALAEGVGLASFYWLPVFCEWRLVGSEDAFTGFYHYSRHFISPLALVGAYDRSTTIPFSLGPILPLLAAFNLLVLVRRREETTPAQRRLVAFCAASLAICLFLMSPGSAMLWEHAPLLHRLQFPWRILTLVTVLGTTLAGAMLPWRNETYRAWAAMLLVLAMLGLSRQYTDHQQDASIRLPETAVQLRERYFAPDLRNEWLPRGAVVEVSPRLRPVAGPGCQVDDFRLDQGRLSCQVHATRDSFVVLPHYYFPVGFHATIAGRPIALGVDSQGRMRVDLPAGSAGLLEVRFSRTPMRSWGLMLSGVSLLALVGLCFVSVRAGNGSIF